MPHDNVEFFAKVHQEIAKADQAAEFVDVFASAPSLPETARVEFAKIASVIRIQKSLIVHLLEENQQLFDNLEAAVRKIPKQD